MLAVIVAGWGAGLSTGSGDVAQMINAAPYQVAVAAMLAVGLYSSAHGIDLRHLRTDLKTVVAAVTVGVLLKALLVAAVMFWLFDKPEYLVLGVAVAQIDPLSVAALSRSARLSERGRALLLAWASFDDPVTTLLTIYAATLALAVQNAPAADQGLATGGVGQFGVDLLGNLGLAAAAALVWWARRRGRVLGARLRFWGACAVLAVVALIAVWQFWMLAVALVALFLRPSLPDAPQAFQRLLDRLTTTAFTLAALTLGVILCLDARPAAGLVLGLIAFAAQSVTALFLTRSQRPSDRVCLAIAQQNGITAITLALLLEPQFPGTVAVVAPGILVINTLHAVANALFERFADRWWPPPAPDEPNPPNTPPAEAVVPDLPTDDRDRVRPGVSGLCPTDGG